MTSNSIRRALAAFALDPGHGGRRGRARGPSTGRSRRTAASTCSTTCGSTRTGRSPARWASGITLLGYGPNGETMVFDSEEAIHLYNFKHNRPGDPRPQPTPRPGPTITWRDGATTLLFPGRRPGAHLQPHPAALHPRAARRSGQLPGTGGPGDSPGSFRIRRAKFKIDGWFYKPWLLYELQLNWPAVTDAQPRRHSSRTPTSTGTSRRASASSWSSSASTRRPSAGSSSPRRAASSSWTARSVSDNYARGRETGFQLWGRLLGRQDRVARGGLQRQRPHPDRQRQRQVPVHRPRDVAAQRRGAAGTGLGNSGPLLLRGRLRVRRQAALRRGRSATRTTTSSAPRPPST